MEQFGMTLIQQLSMAYFELNTTKLYQFIKRKRILNDIRQYNRQIESLDIFSLALIILNFSISIKNIINFSYLSETNFDYHDIDRRIITYKTRYDSIGVYVSYTTDKFDIICEESKFVEYHFPVTRATKLPRSMADIWGVICIDVREALIEDINTISKLLAKATNLEDTNNDN